MKKTVKTPLKRLRDALFQLETLSAKLDELWASGRRRVLSPVTIGQYRYMANDAKRHVESVVRESEAVFKKMAGTKGDGPRNPHELAKCVNFAVTYKKGKK